MLTRPSINTGKMADEIKEFVDKKKFDMIDYSLVNIEAYPPNSDEYPETKKFSDQWAAFFEEAEKALADTEDEPGKITFSAVLEKHSPELAKSLAEFDNATAAVAAAVNSDSVFWEKLRGTVLPLYEKSTYYEQWKERWRSISIAYDPTPLQVVTTQMYTNKKTGERIRGDVLRTTEYPAGFTVKIN